MKINKLTFVYLILLPAIAIAGWYGPRELLIGMWFIAGLVAVYYNWGYVGENYEKGT